MPPLDNRKHELFAQELAKGKTASEAYILAGYKANDGNAATLKGNQRVADRVTELQERSAVRAEITLEDLIREAGEIQEAAKADKQYSAATAALTAKAKLSGHWIDKAENTNRNFDANSLTDAELAAVAASDRGEDTAAAPGRTSKPH